MAVTKRKSRKKKSKSKIVRFALRLDRSFYEGDAKKVADSMEVSLNDLFTTAIKKYVKDSPFLMLH